MILVITDIYGFAAARNREICDDFAKEGYTVVLPDWFDGKPWPEASPFDAAFMAWVKTFPAQPLVSWVYDQLVPELAKESKELRGVIGFCWGVWLLCQVMAADTKQTIRVGLQYHPSTIFLEGTVFSANWKDLVEKVRGAHFIAPAGNDPADYKPNGDYYNILEKNNPGKILGIEYYNEQHGYACRGDIKNDMIRKDVEHALSTGKMFIKKHI